MVWRTSSRMSPAIMNEPPEGISTVVLASRVRSDRNVPLAAGWLPTDVGSDTEVDSAIEMRPEDRTIGLNDMATP